MLEEKLAIEKELQGAQEDLEDLEMYIGEFSSFLPLPVCTITPAGVIIDTNKAFGVLTNYKPEEISGELLEAIFSNKKEIHKILKKVQEEKSVQTKEMRLLSKGKKEIPVNISVSARKDREGNFIGYFIAISDITGLKELQTGLEEQVSQRTKELQEKIEELEKFQKIAIGRELKMVELKKEIENLKKE